MEHPAGGGGGGPTWPDAPPEAPPTLEWPAGSPPGRPPPLPPAPAVEPSRPGGGARTAIGVVLLVVAGLSAALAVAAAAARHELRSSDTWEATSRALAEDPDVQRDVASALAEQVVAAVGVEDRLRGVLPGPLGSLADPVAERTVELVGEATLRLVRTEAFQDAWAAAVRNSHEELLAAFDGEGRFTAVTSEGVVLDLGATLDGLRQLLEDEGVPFLDDIDLSGVDVQIVLIDAPGLQRVGDVLDVLDVLVVVLPVVALLAAVAGLLVARRRAAALAAGGLGASAGAVVVLLVVRAGRAEGADRLTGGILGAGAADAVVAEVGAGLDGTMAAVAVVGLVVAVVGGVAAAVSGRPAR